MTHDYIALDWGSTNLRAWRYQQGRCVDELRAPSGVTQLGHETAQQAFARLLGPWLQQQDVPVIMAGMIGSNAGWIEAPYMACPARLPDLRQHLVQVTPALPVRAWIVPGLSINREGHQNVMRGEETQLLGAHAMQPAQYYLLPGTHCKWVQMQADKVMDFQTVITGELHHVLLKHSLLGAGLPAQIADPGAFALGLETGLNDSHILGRLFQGRAARVLGRLPASAVADWLSGLLIGNEVGQMQQQWGIQRTEPLVIVGSPALAQRYQQALAATGLSSTLVDGDTAFQTGIRSIVHDLAY
ncbi:2-dehydro-3-deoxygalactonokinase [Silvimonas terrae]|uniref:2-dehydro-3-deoxygalactonokinase n=1 Tax=Silvimonas terrae TaxID=300266 RepID=A0A840RDP9_9NEIS|nr:2-dehydro-3-deoxygalactonokinase [Silvimonas terrae]MBB5190490.1 2-dehydro-3-deoxygalactonokinase [Silvimonas terrae]